MVLASEQPTITLNGTSNLAREYEAFVQGIELFSTVLIMVNHEPEPEEDEEGVDDFSNDEETKKYNGVDKLMNVHKLDSCVIQVYPPLNPNHEYFRLPLSYMNHLGVRYKEGKDGIVIHGKFVFKKRYKSPSVNYTCLFFPSQELTLFATISLFWDRFFIIIVNLLTI
jgi:hypothetical protein